MRSHYQNLQYGAGWFRIRWDVAASLGINIKHIRVILLGFTALIAADIVANAGAIRFIDLVIPHPCRMHGHLIRITAPFGGILLSGATMINAHYLLFPAANPKATA